MEKFELRELDPQQTQALDKADEIVGEAMKQAGALIRENFGPLQGRRCYRCSCPDFKEPPGSGHSMKCRCGHLFGSHDVW